MNYISVELLFLIKTITNWGKKKPSWKLPTGAQYKLQVGEGIQDASEGLQDMEQVSRGRDFFFFF